VFEPMVLQMTLSPERLITHITEKWQLPSMNALMFLQAKLFSE
jgi:hypothetical protein